MSLAAVLAFAWFAAPANAASTVSGVTVTPTVGGPLSTFTVAFATSADYGFYRVEVSPRCHAVTSFPWRQTLALVGPPFWHFRNAVQIPRPVAGGWCPGLYRGRLTQVFHPTPTKVTTKTLARFTFTVRRGTRTPLREPPCRPRGSRTVRETATARVYRTRYGGGTWTWGCLFSVRGHMQLSRAGFTADEVDVISMVRLAGPFAAYLRASSGPADVETSVAVTDLRTGRGMSDWMIPDSRARALVLSASTGAVAWTARTEGGVMAVNAMRGTHVRELDTGKGIDPRSLRLSGSTLTWTHDGVARSATMP